MQAVGRVGRPGKGVGEERCAVEQVAEKGGNEEGRGEAGGGAAHVVFVELGEARAEVEKGRTPREDAANKLRVA